MRSKKGSRRVRWIFWYILFLIFLLTKNSFALTAPKAKKDSGIPAVMKADEVEGDQITNNLIARGNVEISKGTSVIYADKITYNKDNKIIRAIGHVKIKDIEIGKVYSAEAEVNDDFSRGKFFNSTMVLNDGSYLISPEIYRLNPQVTILDHPTFSICPDDDIVKNNELAGKKFDLISIKSSKTTIDREEGVIRTKHGIMRLYNVPFFYSPYMTIPLPAKERQSGFLTPSYTKSTNLGIGVKLPYYFNIAPNMELTTTPFFGMNTGQIMLNNDFRHKANYGDYKLDLELANNKVITSTTSTANRTNNQYRWNFFGDGIFDFTKNFGADFNINTIGDRNYLRDYHFKYFAYTTSKINFDYIKQRDYYAIKTIRFQEIENISDQQSSPIILPSIDAHLESKPFLSKERFVLTSNVTAVNRQSGLEYRRATLIPEVKVPFNLHGNLFDLDGKLQTDFYSLDNNFKSTTPDTTPATRYDSTMANYKPEVSLNWRLPLIKKLEKQTIMVEPMANFVMSSYTTSFSKLPNEDSNDSELTVSNLFTSDRIYGFDRNETGKRVNYGVKTSWFNRFGEFGLLIGQGYKKSSKIQDVTIRGFADNNKSNFVGQASYKAIKYFSLLYSFQLNESNYRNEVNQVTTSLTFERFSISADYLLLRKNEQNPEQKEQVGFSSSIKLSSRWRTILTTTKDLQNRRTLSRSIMLAHDGCCTVFNFSVMENSPSNLIKPQRTFNFSLSFKNL